MHQEEWERLTEEDREKLIEDMRETCTRDVIEVSTSLVFKKWCYVVVVMCVFRFMYCVVVVFMMQQLKSIGVLIHPNLIHLDIVEKVVLGGAITKGSCSSPNQNIFTTITC